MIASDSGLLNSGRKNPCLTGTAIAGQVGVSRESVRQILFKEEPATRGVRVFKYGRFICVVCGAAHARQHVSSSKFYCSLECHRKQDLIPVVCDHCGCTFQGRRWDILSRLRLNPNRRLFCGRRCFGLWMQKNDSRFSAQAVKNKQKTHCIRGHPLSGENVRCNKDGHRHCKAYMRVSRLARYWSKSEKELSTG